MQAAVVINLTFREHLSRAYDQRIHRNKPRAFEIFVAATQGDPELMTQARRRLVELTDDVCARCFVSKHHRTILQHLIKEAEAHA